MNQHTKPNAPVLDSYWMPFTANRQFKQAPRLLASAEGMHYTSTDGRTILDGTAGLWCVNAGHGRRQIASAVERQLSTMDFAPPSRWAIRSPSTSPNASPKSRQARRDRSSTASSSPAPARNRSTPP